jgi:3,4-dihydroxy 2-butanone 4-phosphate synthase / GTP cyclohydrolase II
MGAYPVSAVRSAEANLPSRFGEFRVVAYRDIRSGKEHAAFVKGDVATREPVLVRLHSECLTGDAFGSLRCDCGPQLAESLRLIEAAGAGVILYLRQEGRDIGLIDKIAAYELQDQGLDTVDANLQLGHPVDARTYDAGMDMLRDLGVHAVRLLTNNPAKVAALRAMGMDVVERLPLETEPHDGNSGYLAAKKARMGHILDRV